MARRAAKAHAAATRQSSQRSVSAKRPMPAWMALRFHSAAVNGVPRFQRPALVVDPLDAGFPAFAYLSYQAR